MPLLSRQKRKDWTRENARGAIRFELTGGVGFRIVANVQISNTNANIQLATLAVATGNNSTLDIL